VIRTEPNGISGNVYACWANGDEDLVGEPTRQQFQVKRTSRGKSATVAEIAAPQGVQWDHLLRLIAEARERDVLCVSEGRTDTDLMFVEMQDWRAHCLPPQSLGTFPQGSVILGQIMRSANDIVAACVR
jgi:hypothetical protein